MFFGSSVRTPVFIAPSWKECATFSSHPELLSLLPYVESLEDNEAITASGLHTYSIIHDLKNKAVFDPGVTTATTAAAAAAAAATQSSTTTTPLQQVGDFISLFLPCSFFCCCCWKGIRWFPRSSPKPIDLRCEMENSIIVVVECVPSLLRVFFQRKFEEKQFSTTSTRLRWSNPPITTDEYQNASVGSTREKGNYTIWREIKTTTRYSSLHSGWNLRHSSN